MPQRVFRRITDFESDAFDSSDIIRSACEFIGRLRLERNVTGRASRERDGHCALVTSNVHLRCPLQAFSARADDNRVVGVCERTAVDCTTKRRIHQLYLDRCPMAKALFRVQHEV